MSQTRSLRRICKTRGWVVFEQPNGYDALIEDYSPDRDLLVEVKTEALTPFVRMAVGQLLDYRRSVTRPDKTDLVVGRGRLIIASSRATPCVSPSQLSCVVRARRYR